MLCIFLLLPAPLPGRAAAVGMAAMNTPAAGSRLSFLALVMAVFIRNGPEPVFAASAGT